MQRELTKNADKAGDAYVLEACSLFFQSAWIRSGSFRPQ